MYSLRLLFWSILLPIVSWESASQPSPFHSLNNKKELRSKLRRQNNAIDENFQVTRILEGTNDVLNASGSKTSPDFDRIIWPHLKQNLCPHMVPNIEMAQDKIFFLARQRVGFNRAYQLNILKELDGENDVYQRFFEFNPPLSFYPWRDIADEEDDDDVQKKPKTHFVDDIVVDDDYNDEDDSDDDYEYDYSSSENDNTYLKDDDDTYLNYDLDDDDFNDDRHIMAYITQWRCANQQIQGGMKRALGKSFSHAIPYLDFFLSLHPSQSRYPPCLVTAIRDPIIHFLSGYDEIERQFRIDRHNHLSQLVFSRYQDGTTLRFEQFVRDFLSAPDVHPMENPLLVEPLRMPHVYSMSGVLAALARYNRTLTDYLPSIENITYTWPHFASTTCPDVTFPDEFFEEPTKSGSDISLDDIDKYYEAAETVWSEGGEIAQALCILHIMDYACFDKLDIPLLCRNVYSEKAIVDLLAPGVFPEDIGR